MSRKAKCQHLLEKSVHAALSAIEIYNKPDFKYREESFSILMVNAWELLLKARILQGNKNKLESIYIVDPNKTRKDGKPYKKPKYKTSRSGNYLTIDVTNAMKELKLPERLKENLGLLIEIRDNAIHFMNDSKLFEKKFLEIGTSSLKSYVNMVNKWFDYDLSQYNFYLMPISFFHNHEMQSFSINKEDKQHQNLLKFIAAKEKTFPSDETQEHNISLILETKWVKSKSVDALTTFRYDPDDPNAITYKVDSEEEFRKKYPWSWTNNLKPKLQTRYNNFKMDQKFWTLKKSLENDRRYMDERHLDWNNLKGTKKKFYSTEILKEFDKHYDKK
jgi:hypothetical protein